MYLQGITIFCLAFVSTSFCYDNIHDDRVFDQIHDAILTGADIDRKYEIAPIELHERLHKRSSSLPVGLRIKTRAFGKDIDLWLHPATSIFASEHTPVYYARYAPGQPQNVTFLRQRDLMKDVGRLLENPTELASMVIGTGKYQGRKVNGRLGKHGLVIRSLPDNVVEEYVRKRRSINEQDDSLNLNYHLVYEDDNLPNTVEKPVRDKRAILANVSKIPDILFPEILVVVEYSLYKDLTMKRGITGALAYLLAYWNGVDLYYRGLENPRVRFNIAGIIFAVDDQALSYIKINNTDNPKSLIVEETTASSRYFFGGIRNSFPKNRYDVAVTLSKLPFARDQYGSKIAGKAYVGSSCLVENSPDIIHAVALIHDNGAFLSIQTTAHELGHSFGLWHDFDDEDCKYTDGYIMAAAQVYTKNSSMFSRCSLEQFDRNLAHGDLECLYNRPTGSYDDEFPKLSPGKMVTLDEQCKFNGYGHTACVPEDTSNYNVCVSYWCLEEDGECRKSGIAPVDGSVCIKPRVEKPGFCLHNECVHL